MAARVDTGVCLNRKVLWTRTSNSDRTVWSRSSPRAVWREIYLARTGGIRGFEKFLVLKMIHPKWSQDESFISMLIEEAKLAVNLTHANIAQVFDLGLHEDTYYIAMEYVDGRDLFQVLVRTSELDTYIPFDAAAHIAEQVAAALYFAHTRRDQQGRDLNLIHRDISPQNVIISMNGEIKLIDFGIAKASQRPGHTQVGIIKGKFYYMSPEQAWGKNSTTARTLFRWASACTRCSPDRCSTPRTTSSDCWRKSAPPTSRAPPRCAPAYRPTSKRLSCARWPRTPTTAFRPPSTSSAL